jgi:ribulose bisphosphate carboxylase small subunit
MTKRQNVSKKLNLSSGIGDPYWYEWSVGLLYALDMLNPDSDIKHVQFQAQDSQKLDDIVIVYKNNSATRIQVKNTRVEGIFNFSDLVGDDKFSLLNSFFTEWQNLRKTNNPCRVILYSNRKPDTKIIPIFNSIRAQINDIVDIKNIKIDKKYCSDYAKLCDCFSSVDSALSLDFLKDFEIKLEQNNLNETGIEIEQKLANYFNVNYRKIKDLHIRLRAALMDWTTTRSDRKVTREGLFEALSLHQDQCAGEHSLSVCEPFFTSRDEFISELETCLIQREKPYIFLSGEPGSGKTNIISRIANKENSVIQLRFHAFKPFSPGGYGISADEGIYKSEDFWGDLLIELRDKCRGKIAKYNVPVCNALISVDNLREEVLNIAEKYALENNITFVIAVDGIDHAVRAGKENNFLSKLPFPDEMPTHISFIVAGQPIDRYAYPPWFSSDGIILKTVPSVIDIDIIQDLENKKVAFSDCNTEDIAKHIVSATFGNTLSAVFLVNECTRMNSIAELKKRITESKISDGI